MQIAEIGKIKIQLNTKASPDKSNTFCAEFGLVKTLKKIYKSKNISTTDWVILFHLTDSASAIAGR